MVTAATTRKGGNRINGASLNGGTLVWITGLSNNKLIRRKS